MLSFQKSRTPRSRTARGGATHKSKQSPAPKADVLPSAPVSDVVRLFAADDSVGAYLPCQWAGRRSNPRLRFFRPPLGRLSYQPKLGSLLGLPVRCGHEKRLGVCVTPSLHEEVVRF